MVAIPSGWSFQNLVFFCETKIPLTWTFLLLLQNFDPEEVGGGRDPLSARRLAMRVFRSEPEFEPPIFVAERFALKSTSFFSLGPRLRIPGGVKTNEIYHSVGRKLRRRHKG